MKTTTQPEESININPNECLHRIQSENLIINIHSEFKRDKDYKELLYRLILKKIRPPNI